MQVEKEKETGRQMELTVSRDHEQRLSNCSFLVLMAGVS